MMRYLYQSFASLLCNASLIFSRLNYFFFLFPLEYRSFFKSAIRFIHGGFKIMFDTREESQFMLRFVATCETYFFIPHSQIFMLPAVEQQWRC